MTHSQKTIQTEPNTVAMLKLSVSSNYDQRQKGNMFIITE
jgi:hypothetical protein